jgi:hypothetical protein
MSSTPVTITITLQAARDGSIGARIVGWGEQGGRYGSLWSRALPAVATAGDSPASVLAGLVSSLGGALAATP